MDVSQAKKLSQDKIEADFLTKIVRRNIKRKEFKKKKRVKLLEKHLKYFWSHKKQALKHKI